MNLEKRQIWYFKEPRSGSTWLLPVLEKVLKKPAFRCDDFFRHSLLKDNFIDNKKYVSENTGSFSNTNYFYTTHYFYLLEEMKYFDNPYLIRITRKNKLEQCLSLIYFHAYENGMWHYFSDHLKNPNYNFFLKTKKNPIYITKRMVYDAVNLSRENVDYWNKFSTDHESFTFVYEDLNEGIKPPFYDQPIKFSDDITMLKIPDYKNEVFLNYEEVVGWAKEFIINFGLTTD